MLAREAGSPQGPERPAGRCSFWFQGGIPCNFKTYVFWRTTVYAYFAYVRNTKNRAALKRYVESLDLP